MYIHRARRLPDCFSLYSVDGETIIDQITQHLHDFRRGTLFQNVIGHTIVWRLMEEPAWMAKIEGNYP
jgi:hypothetical protein